MLPANSCPERAGIVRSELEAQKRQLRQAEGRNICTCARDMSRIVRRSTGEIGINTWINTDADEREDPDQRYAFASKIIFCSFIFRRLLLQYLEDRKIMSGDAVAQVCRWKYLCTCQVSGHVIGLLNFYVRLKRSLRASIRLNVPQ